MPPRQDKITIHGPKEDGTLRRGSSEQRPASRWRPQCRGIILSVDLDTTLVRTLSREPISRPFLLGICPILPGIGCAFLRGACCASNKLADRLAKGRSFKRRDPSTIHPSRADLSVLITFYIFRGAPFGFPFEAWGATPCPCYFTTCRIEGRSRAWSKIIKSNGTIQPISWL